MRFADVEIPENSVLGVNYSGMHDTSIAIVDRFGRPIFASSLERHSRYKQDGRPPSFLVDEIPWNKIDLAAISTDYQFADPKQLSSKFLDVKLPKRKLENSHSGKFYEFINSLPCEKEFVCHQMAHAASAFWHSPFESSICLTYDGGMLNSPWFGGVYKAEKKAGLDLVEGFSTSNFAKITSLYSFVTAILGFSPLRHEGKITGMAALGTANDSIIDILNDWFKSKFLQIEKCINWHFVYEGDNPPVFLVNEAEIEAFRQEVKAFKKEDIAASIQKYTEDHVLNIVNKMTGLNAGKENLCLAGGLFANVKLNQKIYESGLFKNLFVAPAMTDDGTALGAAWHVVSKKRKLKLDHRSISMYLGHNPNKDQNQKLLETLKIKFTKTKNAQKEVAQLLSDGKIIALFQGAMEFGPRALGNRSILSQATDTNINLELNKRLNRTEFMPFAPVTRAEDVAKNYKNTSGILDALEYMTVTVNCTEEMIEACPAVIHTDGTARPQIVSKEKNDLVYNILTEYNNITGINSLINTSFNTHEEPIVCYFEDAISGLFMSGIDYLYLDGGLLINMSANKAVAYDYIRNKRKTADTQGNKYSELINLFFYKDKILREELDTKETEMKEIETEVENYRKQLQEKEESITEKEDEIKSLSGELNYLISNTDRVGENISEEIKSHKKSVLFTLNYSVKKIILQRITLPFRQIFLPKLGIIHSYPPRELLFDNGKYNFKSTEKPKISIAVPSFNQGKFIKNTIESILGQEYENKEIFVADGKSTDNTVKILKMFDNKIKWVSKKDKGQADAINNAFQNSDGEIMAWINSDDVFFPNTFEIVVDYFNRNPDVDVVYGNRIILDELGQEVGRWVLPKHDHKVIVWVDFIPQETMFWRRRIWNKVGGSVDASLNFALDWDLILRFKEANAKFLHIPRFLSGFRAHKDQKTVVSIDKTGKDEMNFLRERSLGFVPSQNEIKKHISFYLVKHILAHIKYLITKRIYK